MQNIESVWLWTDFCLFVIFALVLIYLFLLSAELARIHQCGLFSLGAISGILITSILISLFYHPKQIR